VGQPMFPKLGNVPQSHLFSHYPQKENQGATQ
jgi:hypothetical protein